MVAGVTLAVVRMSAVVVGTSAAAVVTLAAVVSKQEDTVRFWSCLRNEVAECDLFYA